MKLAELEAKAKALAGTQHWRGLDPEAVLEALDEVARLRAENGALRALLAECRETLEESRLRFEQHGRPTDEIEWLLATMEAQEK